MNYSVGNLELSIQTLDKSTASFNNVINSLSSMLNIVGELSTAFRGLGQINDFANGLAKIAKIDLTPVAENIKKIPESVQPLANLGAGFKGLQKITKLDVAGFDAKIKSLTASLRPFLNELTMATPALTAFSTAMTSLKGRKTIGFSQFKQPTAPTKSFEKTLNLAGIVGKLYFIRNYTKQLGRFGKDLVQSAIDYTETLNLWQVAMRGNLETAEEFITKMNKAYGIAEQTLMKYQATFRNMLATLGGISSDVSYGLSESLTQMALDYASLYNTSIEKAMTVFQSVLSGQVRPIRSISGYDITETTIFEIYQQLGGTKTMRQLTQTEKRLLRIYAVFQQMDRSGAIGDLNKTLNNTANQVRIMSESVKELGVWMGKLIEIHIAPAIPYLNAFFITAKNIMEAIVKGLPQYSEFDGTIKGYQETAEAMDEVQGKLLDFDKFRSLSSSDKDNNLGIDAKLIEGLARYESILNNVSNKATELAEAWTSWWVDDETGALTTQAENLLSVLKSIGLVVSALIGYKLITKIGALIGGITGLKSAMALLNATLAVGVIASFMRAIELFEEGDIWGGILATTIGVTLVGALVLFNLKAGGANVVSQILSQAFVALTKTATLAGIGISSLFAGIIAISTADMGWGQKLISILVALAAAAAGAAIAFHALKGNWVGALSVAGIVGGGVLTISSVLGNMSTQKFKNGGLVEDGLFTMNKGEIIGTFDDGSTIVANNQQIVSGIEQGVYKAVVSAMQNDNKSGNKNVYNFQINGRTLLTAMEDEMHKQGKKLSKY